MTLRPTSLVRAGCVGALTRWACLLLTVCLIGCGGDEQAVSKTEPTTHAAGVKPVDESAAPPRPVTISSLPPAPKPTAALPAGAKCVTPECHSTFATSAQIHAPVAEQACDACHEPDAGGHRYPLKRGTVDANCKFCHAVSQRQEHQHAALEQGCTTCHDPHASPTKFLLAAPSVEMLCGNCHQTSLKKFAHRPYLKGECTLCHQPHEADNPSLLRGGAVPQHCFQCHEDLSQKMIGSTHQHEPAQRDCGACHDAHTSNHAALLKRSLQETCFRCHDQVRQDMTARAITHGAMDQDRGCAACHDPHAADGALLMNGRMSDVCLTCHASDMKTSDGRVLAGMKQVLSGARHLHGAIKLGDCSACHAGHAGDRPMLLIGSFPSSSYARFEVGKYGLCFGTCHSPQLVLTPVTQSLTNFRNGSANLHYVHVNRAEKGRSCRTCHAVHGSDLPNHMAAQVPFERSSWAMPIGFQKSDDGGRCAPGCHAPRTYARSAKDVPPPATQTAVTGGSP
jgi:predicted CXXCH cytochrome family protein